MLREIPINFKHSTSDKTPSKSLEYFLIKDLDSKDFFVVNFAPLGVPILFPANFAVSIPSLVRICKSSSSFCACSKTLRICSLAKAIV